jgi:phospholipid transport system substrate-binding protein
MSLKSNPTQVYSLANKLVVPHADLDYMSKRVLPPQIWAQASNAQRTDFKREFTSLLVRTYASALADYSDQTVKFYPVRGGAAGKSTVQVSSEIVRSDGPSIPVSYSLIAAGSQWKVYDMTVEGVSMLESFRSQFANKLSQGNMSDLISALKQHNQQNSGA